ncbi:MAG TPA: cell division protein ZapB [Thermoanaerobaculia bacterium]|nr:cell division protein ZapB [Thermoanaerobaculia bacterium]
MKKNRDEEKQLLLGDEGEILARLSERVEKAVAAIHELRKERDALRTKLDQAEQQLREQTDSSQRLANVEDEYERYRKERSDIRNRIESILGSLEALENAEAE